MVNGIALHRHAKRRRALAAWRRAPTCFRLHGELGAPGNSPTASRGPLVGSTAPKAARPDCDGGFRRWPQTWP